MTFHKHHGFRQPPWGVMVGSILALLMILALGCQAARGTPTPSAPAGEPAEVTAQPTATARPGTSPVAEAAPTPTPAPPSPTAPPPSATPTLPGDPSPTPAVLPAVRSPEEVITPGPPRFPFTITLELFVSMPEPPTYVTHAGDGSGRLFVVTKPGRIWVVENGTLRLQPFLDISNLVKSDAYEQGLFSVAFAPDYAQSGEFYVNYTARAGDGDTVVARYRVSTDPNVADPTSAETVLVIDQPAANHNGGQLQFGPDGYLYIGTGDGGRAGDPWDNAENLGVLLGKMLRIDVKGTPTYTVPADNPFVGQAGVRPEIWAYGLRNPWRFSFDRQTGDLYIADVGQGKWEEVHVQPASSRGGEHYGWDTMEGAHCFEPETGCDMSGKELPVVEYDHSLGCSITGGYVYRGSQYPQLAGTYFFADFCSGRIWGLRPENGTWRAAELLSTSYNIASFGEDEAGELYVVDLNGAILRITSAPAADQVYLPLVVQAQGADSRVAVSGRRAGGG